MLKLHRVLKVRSWRFCLLLLASVLCLGLMTSCAQQPVPVPEPEPLPPAESQSEPSAPLPEPQAEPAPEPAAEPAPEPAAVPTEPESPDAPPPETYAQPAAPASQAPDTPAASEPQSGMVWVAASGKGKKYHSVPVCGKMTDSVQISLQDAEAQGYTPCKNCH